MASDQAIATSDGTDISSQMMQALQSAKDLSDITESKHEELEKEANKEVNSLTSMTSSDPHFKDLHDKYMSFGNDDLKQYLPQMDEDTPFDMNLNQMERQSEASKDVAKVLEKLSSSFSEMDTKSLLHRPKSKFFQKFYDPVKMFVTRASKANKVINGIFEELTKYKNQLMLEIVQYRKDRDNAQKAVKIAKEKAALAESIANALRERIVDMEANNADPEIILALKSEVLAAISQRAMDLISIASVQSQYVVSADILIKGHEHTIDSIVRAENTSVVQLNTAIRIAQGISSQSNAQKMTRQLKESFDNLSVTNAVNLRNSSQEIFDEQNSTINDVESLKKAIDISVQTVAEINKNEAASADNLVESIKKAKSYLAYIENRSSNSKQMSEQKAELLSNIETGDQTSEETTEEDQ
jgi:uncharacterized protein YaaN involved in tellurite resistance